jgi:hypothetical protein
MAQRGHARFSMLDLQASLFLSCGFRMHAKRTKRMVVFSE